MTRAYGHDNAGQPYVACDDEDCATNACPEHGGHDALGDHTFEQHHDPTEHCGTGPCLCPGYGLFPSESPEAEYIARCPACGDVIDYCQGHGEMGDPAGFAILAAHDDDDHSECHPDGCEEAPR